METAPQASFNHFDNVWQVPEKVTSIQPAALLERQATSIAS